MLTEIEPSYELTRLKLRYVDDLLPDRLLAQLGVDKTCLLRGDYWHLMNEVFPKNHNFGNKV